MERQYKIFIIAAAAIFGGLVIFGLYFFPQIKASEGEGDGVFKARMGDKINLRYSEAVVNAIQNLPVRNALEVETSSELHNTALSGVRGKISFTEAEITYVQNGKVETETDETFGSIEYRFRPDKGNTTTYTYKNVEFVKTGDNSQVIVTVEPLNTARVGERYTVELKLDTGGLVNYGFGKKTIEIIP